MTTAIDISQYSGEVSVADFTRAKAEGCSRVIVALNDLDLAKRQITNASKAGLEVEAYIYLYFARSITARVRAGLDAIRGLPVRRVWIDAEDTTSGVTQASIIEGIRIAERMITEAGYRTGIYTAKWFWTGHAGNSTAFKHLPLWDAYWDQDPDIDRPTYGGWGIAYMTQFAADTRLAGIWCDINSYTPEQETTVQPPSLSALTTIPTIISAVFNALRRRQREEWADGYVQYAGGKDLGNGYREHQWTITLRERVK